MAKTKEELKKELNPVVERLYRQAEAKAKKDKQFPFGEAKLHCIRAQTAINSGNEPKARSEINAIQRLVG